MLAAVSRPPTGTELQDVDALLRRASPERLPGSMASRHIGMQALTLTRDSLPLLKRAGFIFNKVNGIGALCAVPNGGKASVVFILRNGIFAVDNVAMPLRQGRALIDGELCIRRELSLAEKARIERIPCVLELDYLDADDGDPGKDSLYKLCFATHDLLVDDEANASSSRSRTGDAVCVQTSFIRLCRLKALTESVPSGNARGEENVKAAAADFVSRGIEPAVTVFFKEPYLASNIREALRTLRASMRGISLDGFVFMPATGPYLVGQTNTQLLKHKAWRKNTADLVVVVQDGVYRFFIVNVNKEAKCISTRLWLGDTPDERALTERTLALEARRLADGGAPDTPLIFECEPSVDDHEAFVGLRDQYAEKAKLLHVAGEHLRWRPVMVRDEKRWPNAEINFWAVVEALVGCVTAEDLERSVK